MDTNDDLFSINNLMFEKQKANHCEKLDSHRIYRMNKPLPLQKQQPTQAMTGHHANSDTKTKNQVTVFSSDHSVAK